MHRICEFPMIEDKMNKKATEFTIDRRNLKTGILLIILLLCPLMLNGQTVTLGTDIWPPYEDLENLTAKGYCTELVVKAMSSIGKEAQLMTYPWSRGIQLLERGTLDGLFSGFLTETRQETFLIPEEPLATLSFVLFGLTGAGEENGITSIQDLAGLKIGIVAGQEFSEENQSMFKDLSVQFVYANSNRENLELLSSGSADFVILELGIGLTWRRALGLTETVEVLSAPVVETEKLYLFLNPESFTESESESISSFLKSYKETAEGKVLFQKYFY